VRKPALERIIAACTRTVLFAEISECIRIAPIRQTTEGVSCIAYQMTRARKKEVHKFEAVVYAFTGYFIKYK
jgi:hypothetical protein